MSKKKIAPIEIDESTAVDTTPEVRIYTIPSLGVSVEAESVEDAVKKANKKVKEL